VLEPRTDALALHELLAGEGEVGEVEAG
jgi:hypothetical protein